MKITDKLVDRDVKNKNFGIVPGWIMPLAIASLPISVALSFIFNYDPDYAKKIELLKKYDFPSEKILTISPTDYCKISGKNLDDFFVIGVRGRNIKQAEYIGCGKNKRIERDIPFGTEVVVNSQIYPSSYNPYNRTTISSLEIGTALIPKGKHSKQKPLEEKNNYILTHK